MFVSCLGRQSLICFCHFLLQNSASGTPPTTFFGVSPPVRSGWAGGAANPISHDTTWAKQAVGASRTNLQALRELESTGGASFLQGDFLIGSPLHFGPSPVDVPGPGRRAGASSSLHAVLQRHSASHGVAVPLCRPSARCASDTSGAHRACGEAFQCRVEYWPHQHNTAAAGGNEQQQAMYN